LQQRLLTGVPEEEEEEEEEEAVCYSLAPLHTVPTRL
jgi:hypothetical protein